MSNHLTSQERKIITLSALGGMLEFYDFIIYGIFSVYFAHQFFPSQNAFMTVLESYLVFVLGYLARPLGGIIFSHIGDEHGRKKVLIITILLMGASSLGIGILPTYSQIGVFAPILLLTLRLTQGLALGGELPSTYVYLSESVPNHRGIAFGITMSGVNSGLLFGMVINYVLTLFLTSQQLTAFGWRLPFIVGGCICIISYRIRKTLHETNVFNKIHDKPKLPMLYLLQNHLKEFTAATLIVSIMSSLVVVTVVFMPTYLHTMLNIDPRTISLAMTVMMVANTISIYYCGKIAQHYAPHLILKWLLGVGCLLIPLSYQLIHANYLTLGLVTLAILEGVAAMITPYMITNLFESKIRLTGVALSYNVGFTLFGGLAPFLITNVLKAGYNVYLTPVIYLLIMICISSLGLRLAYNRPNQLMNVSTVK